MKRFLTGLLAIVLGISILSVSTFAYTWPTESHAINWSYNPPTHIGVDIAPVTRGVSGDDVYSFYGGSITKYAFDTKAGYTCHINHNNPISTGSADAYLLSRYEHMLNPSDYYRLDTSGSVYEGSLIGYMGTTGSTSTGVHLHFEMRVNNVPYTSSSNWYAGGDINPMTFFPNNTVFRANQVLHLSNETPSIGITKNGRFYDARALAIMSPAQLQIHGISQSEINQMLPRLRSNNDYAGAYAILSEQSVR